MPIKRCQVNNKPGYKYGDKGKCYTYTADDTRSRRRALIKAQKQGRAIGE